MPTRSGRVILAIWRMQSVHATSSIEALSIGTVKGIEMSTFHDSDGSGPDNASMNVADAVEAVAASVVGLGTRRRGVAAGVVWKPGMVVTAASAIGHAQEVQVIQPDGETAPGRVRGTDPATDLAVIALEDERLRPAVRRVD